MVISASRSGHTGRPTPRAVAVMIPHPRPDHGIPVLGQKGATAHARGLVADAKSPAAPRPASCGSPSRGASQADDRIYARDFKLVHPRRCRRWRCTSGGMEPLPSCDILDLPGNACPAGRGRVMKSTVTGDPRIWRIARWTFTPSRSSRAPLALPAPDLDAALGQQPRNSTLFRERSGFGPEMVFVDYAP